MDNDRAQAIISYAAGSVNRPIESLVVLVRKDEQIDEKGLCFDPLVRADKELNQVLELEDQLEDEDENQHVDVEEEVDAKKEDGPQEELETSEEDQPKAGETVHRCKECGKMCHMGGKLKKHVPMHSSAEKCNCTICAQLFPIQKDLINHKVDEHEAENPI